MWAAMNGHTEVVDDLIKKDADVNAMEKVRHRYSVITGLGANDQRMFGTGLRDLGAIGRKCPMHSYCDLEGRLTIVLSCARNVQHTRAWMAHA
jgi:hypothetical protein